MTSAPYRLTDSTCESLQLVQPLHALSNSQPKEVAHCRLARFHAEFHPEDDERTACKAWYLSKSGDGGSLHTKRFW